jgi:cytoskeletal protein CcmA (bactofilin family)
MTTQYTTILKLALPIQGELSGTWGDVVNDNITQMVEQAVAGKAVINSWTNNAHTLTSADGTSSESRCAILDLTDTGTALSGVGSVVCPAQTKLYIVENNTARVITVKTPSGSGIAVPVNKTMLVYCDGTNVVEGLTHTNSLSLGTSTTTASSILDEDNMASNSATALSTQQSIKAYVDSQVGTVDTLTEILANGNTTSGRDVIASTDDKVQFRDTAIYINSSTDGQLDIVADTEIQIAATTVDINGAVALNGAMAGGTDITISGALNAATLDISGDIDVDGVSNLDAVDIDGAVSIAADTTIAGTNKIIFNDASQFIHAPNATTLDLAATDEIELTAVLVDVVGNLAVSGAIDLEGNIDVNGTTNLDEVDIDGATQIDAAVTVGVNDTGYDVKFFGDTAGKNLLWDASEDKLDVTGLVDITGPLDVTGTVEFDGLSGTGSVTVTDILDEDNMASNSATALSTQQSIKAYVDSGGSTNALAVVLTAGNTTGGTDMLASTDDKVQFRDSAIYINSSTDGQLDIIADTEVQITATTIDITGSLNVDGSTFKVNASNNRVGILNSSPDVTLDIGTATDAVHMPSGSTGQRPGSPAAGYFRYNTTTAGFEGYTDAWGEIGGGGANLTTNNFTGNGSTTGFTLGINPSVEQNTFVYIDGVYQQKNTYSTSGTTLTFSTAPPNGTSVEVMSMTATNSIVGTVSDNAITTAKIADGNVTLAKMAANSVDSDQYVDGSIDTVHIADSQITVAKMAANSVDSDQYVDGSIDTVHIADDQVTGAKLANNIDIAGTLDVTGLLTADASVSVTGNVDILAQGDLRLQDSAGGQYVAMQAPATIATSYTLTLPADDGDADQVLATNGSGVLDWVTSGGLYDAWSIITSATNLASGGQYISNSSSALTHTLPSGSAGSTIVIKNNGSGLVTIARTSSQKINGVDANATMPQGNAVQLVYVDGTTGWLVL